VKVIPFSTPALPYENVKPRTSIEPVAPCIIQTVP
jgi:hypothetical protein